MSSRHDALIARNISKAYGETVVLDGVSLVVGPGSRTGVVGPNGYRQVRPCSACWPGSRRPTPAPSSASHPAPASPTSSSRPTPGSAPAARRRGSGSRP